MLLVRVDKSNIWCDMAKQKVWRFTKKRQESLAKARTVHSELVELGLKVRGHRSAAKRVRVGRESRS